MYTSVYIIDIYTHIYTYTHSLLASNMGSLCLGYRICMPQLSDLYAFNIGSLCLEYQISALLASPNGNIQQTFSPKSQNLKNSMKFTFHRWFLMP